MNIDIAKWLHRFLNEESLKSLILCNLQLLSNLLIFKTVEISYGCNSFLYE